MLVGVEPLAFRIEPGNAMALHHLEQLALRDLNAFAEVLQGRVLFRRLIRHVIDRALDIVGNGEHVAGKI